MKEILAVIQVILALIGITGYIIGTVKGKTKPNRVTWLMWAIAPLIGTAAAISDGVTLAVVSTFMAGFGPLLVFIASFVNKNSYWKLEKFDYICGLFSVLALILWGVTKDPNVAIIFAIASDFTAGFPTIKKAWTNPETEKADPFITGIMAQTLTLFIITNWSFSSFAFPGYLFFFNIFLIYIILRPQINKLLFSKK